MANLLLIIDILFLKGTLKATFAVPRDWTDLSDPSPLNCSGFQATVLDIKHLVELLEIINHLKFNSKKGLTNEKG